MIRIILRGWVVFFVVIAAGCATAPSSTKVDTAQRASLKNVCAVEGIHYQWDQIAQVIVLKRANAQASVLVGSSTALVGDEKVVLAQPVLIEKNVVYVPVDFKEKIINRLKDQPKTAVTSYPNFNVIRHVVIDAGHGGKDPGAMSRSGLKEKDVVLDIAKHLRRILEHHGIKVKMTRVRDEFISLNERTEIASKTSADLFISIHANSHPSRSVSGMEVYYSKNLDRLERKEDQRTMNQRILFKNLRMDKDSTVENVVEDMLYVNKQAESAALAKKVARTSSGILKVENLGNKQARFFVLRNTLMPAILVEVGFMTNAKEERLLKTDSYRQKVARAIASSVLGYWNE